MAEITRGLGDDRVTPVRAAHVEHYVRDLRRRNLSPATIGHYRNGLERFERQAGISLLEATTDDLADFIVEQSMSDATRYTYIAHLRAFYGWAKDEGHITADPAAGLSYVLRQRRSNG